ncbi:MAG TPA: response regulator transcription factor [Steroidobacteraceae bacterium]|jgi:DNA-binding NarL/FixJ family response regulator
MINNSSPVRSSALGAPGSGVNTSFDGKSRLILVDDHAILREGLIALSEMEPDLKVVGQAGTIAEGIAVAIAQRPDLIITDLCMPGSAGLQGIVEFRQRCAGAKVLVLTMHDSEEHIRAALSAGAQGYVLKDASRGELMHAIRAVIAGQRHLCPRSSARVVRSYLGERPAVSPLASGVTGREREILGMIAAGLSNKRIAIGLGRSVKTVEKHRANLMRKLQLHNVAEVTRFAMESGLLD